MRNKSFLSKIFIMFVLSGILIVAGCSSNDGGDSGATSDQTVVDVFQFKVEFKDQFENLVAQYQEENPDIKINVQTVGGGNDYAASLKSSFAAGNEPDIFNVGGPTEVEEYREYLTDLSDTGAAEAALEGTLSGVTDGDEILGLPYSQEGYGYIYNKEIFNQAGINAEELTTYEALEEAFATLDSQKEELGLDAVIALPAKELWVMGNHLANTYIASDFNDDILEAYEAGTIPFSKSDELQRMLDLQNEYSVQPVLSLDYSQQVEQLFSTGKVALIQQGNWIYPTVEQMDADFAENGIGMIPIPVDGLEGHLPVGVPQYWVVNSNADDATQQAAKDFLDWMYTSDAGKELVLNEFKFIPAYEGYDTEQISDPLSQDVYKHASEGNTIGWVFMASPVGWQEDSLAVGMQRYLSGDITWEQVIEQSRADWENSRK
ncbi:ABC transporter substrate-binding protein [Oceanobacillus saliphilus]|uniref:ABC transporter substrate-binding protein n=1 Tax=Oceanobacillus saliphilus TaxID=2925834 RepID=UPI00201DD0CC|nr:ABC transporter substrate-binding protein [Oceanobacillus saliphilus]